MTLLSDFPWRADPSDRSERDRRRRLRPPARRRRRLKSRRCWTEQQASSERGFCSRWAAKDVADAGQASPSRQLGVRKRRPTGRLPARVSVVGEAQRQRRQSGAPEPGRAREQASSEAKPALQSSRTPVLNRTVTTTVIPLRSDPAWDRHDDPIAVRLVAAPAPSDDPPKHIVAGAQGAEHLPSAGVPSMVSRATHDAAGGRCGR
jgi:hypothetical protein